MKVVTKIAKDRDGGEEPNGLNKLNGLNELNKDRTGTGSVELKNILVQFGAI